MAGSEHSPGPTVRLQKYLAQCGVMSRRAGEQAILDGHVEVNGEVVRRLGTRVDPVHDVVCLDGRMVRPRSKLYIALNKPRGFVCSKRKQGRHRLVGELLPPEWDGLQTVGRLDRDTEGLLFLTNDGDFALRLTHPRYAVPKTYVATVNGRVEPETLNRLLRGVWDNGERLRAASVRLLSASNKRSTVELTLVEGKNREVRRLFAAQGLTVSRLVRTRIGSVRLGELKPGRWRALTPPEFKSLVRGKSTVQRSNPGNDEAEVD